MPSNDAPLTNQDIHKLLTRQHGPQKVLVYYLKIANDASKRAEAAISTQNNGALYANTQIMIKNIQEAYQILSTTEGSLNKK